jgi:MFS family permease
MAIGMGVSGLAVGLARTRHERALLIMVPALGAIAVALFPHSGPSAAYLLSALAGVGYAGVIPITISLAQRLLPHRTGLASGLMMGGAWAIAAAGPPLAELLLWYGGLPGAFYAVAGLLLVSGLLSLALPRSLIERSAAA